MLSLYDCQAHTLEEATPDDVRKRLAGDRAHFWLDIEKPGDADYELLTDAFKFHPLTVEDIRHQNQRAKFEEFDDYQFVVLFSSERKRGRLVFREHHLFIAPTYLVTVHQDPEPAFADVHQRLREGGVKERGGLGFVTYLALSALVDRVFDALEEIDDEADALQERALRRPGPDTLSGITELRHDVAVLRRHLGGERDMSQRLLTTALQGRSQEQAVYFRDIYDHLVRQFEQADGIRDLLSGAMDVYLSTVSNRLNETMRALTAIASLFLPLTFLTGFFGQNFGWLVSRIGNFAAFAAGLTVMTGSVVLQLYLFHRRGWI